MVPRIESEFSGVSLPNETFFLGSRFFDHLNFYSWGSMAESRTSTAVKFGELRSIRYLASMAV